MYKEMQFYSELYPINNMVLLVFGSQDNSMAEWSLKKSITHRTYSEYHPIPVPLNLVTIPIVELYNFAQRTLFKENLVHLINVEEKKKKRVCNSINMRIFV